MSYIRVPPVSPGITVRGKIERVYAPDDATWMEHDEAEQFRVEAFGRWTELDWQIEKVSDKKYVVKAG